MLEETFELATRMKLRFNTDKGAVSTEDLWELSLEALNSVAMALNKELKATEEENFLSAGSKADLILSCKFDTVIRILNIKKQEKGDRAKVKENKVMKDKLMEALVRKQDESLDNMSEAELKKRLKKL